MRTDNPNIEMYTQVNDIYMRVANAANVWNDGQQISAYVNMQKILNLGRASLTEMRLTATARN